MGYRNPYDVMFRNDDLIRKFIDGKYKKCTKGKMTKYNLMFDSRFRKRISEFRSLTRQLLTCKYILKKFGEESNVNVFYYISNIRTMAKSLTENTRMYFVIRNALEEYSVETQEIANAFNASIKKSKERVERIANTFLPEYYELCGLNNYIEYLNNNGTSIKEDIDIFFRTHNDRDANIDEMTPQERAEFFDNISREYYENIKKIMDEKNIPYVDTAEIIIAEEQKRKEYARKKKEKQKQEKDAVRTSFIDEEMNRIEGIIFRAFEIGRPTKTKRMTISEQRLEQVSTAVVSSGHNEFYIVMAMSMRSKSRTVYFLRKNDNGDVVVGNPYSFASCFFSVNKDEAEDMVKNAPSGYYARISKILVTSGQTEYMKDEFNNIVEKNYEVLRNHEYFNDLAHNILVVFRDYTKYIFKYFCSPPARIEPCTFYENSLQDLRNIDENSRKDEYIHLFRSYRDRCADMCGSRRLSNFLLGMARKKYPVDKKYYIMLAVLYKDGSYKQVRYVRWNDNENTIEFTKSIAVSTPFEEERFDELSQIMENKQQEWYNKPLDTVYLAWDFVKIPYTGIKDYSVFKDIMYRKSKKEGLE